MTSRQRLQAALNHQSVDRVPIDLGSTNVSTLHISAYRALLEQMGLEDPHPVMMERTTQLVVPCEALLKGLHVDTRGVRLAGAAQQSPHRLERAGGYVDAWGIGWELSSTGLHYEAVHFPLEQMQTLNEVKAYRFPKPQELFSGVGVRQKAQRLYHDTQYGLVGSFGSGVFSRAQQMRGYEQFLVDLLIDPEIAEYILDRILELRLLALDTLITEAGTELDVVEMADDLAAQTAPIISLELYRKLIKPRTARLVGMVKERTGAKVMMHCCGAATEFLQDFVELGVDILNPVQVSASGMATSELKKRWGDQLCFWGAIDAQHVLPEGTPGQVRLETLGRLTDLNHNGGYIACASHNIQADVPVQNIVEMYRCLRGE